MVTLIPPRTDSLPEGPLLAARLLALYPLWPGLLGIARLEPGVAAFGWLEWTDRIPDVLWLGWSALYLASVAALWLGRFAPLAAVLAGSIILASPLLDLAQYSNNRILVGLVLVLLGLYDDRWGLWPLRAQLSLMYGAAALNKMLEPDWRDGTFIEHWTGEVLDLRIYGAVRDAWSGADRLVGWSAFSVEAVLAVLFLVESRTRWAIGAALGFHLGMLVFTEGDISWFFAYGVGASLVAFATPRSPWPYLAALMGLRVVEVLVS